MRDSLLDVCQICKRTKYRHLNIGGKFFCSHVRHQVEFKPYPKKPHIVAVRGNGHMAYIVYDCRGAYRVIAHAQSLPELTAHWGVLVAG